MALVSVSCCVSWPRVSVCDPQQVMDTDQQVADSSTRDHWDLISELLSTQRGRRDTNIILASYKPSSCAVCVVCGPYQTPR